MNKRSRVLTLSEQNLLERFAQYDEKELTPAARDILNEYKNNIFIQDIFAIIVEDVLKALSLTEWNQTSYEKIISEAQNIYNMSGCFFPANQHFLFALSIVWISHFCRYKDTINILTSEIKPRSLFNDAKVLEYSLCAQFFNYFAGPPWGKAKALEKYMFSTYGRFYRDSCTNNDHLVNFNTLLHFISLTGFSYQMPEEP